MMQFEYHHTKLSKTIAEKKYDQVAYEIDEIREVAEKIEKLKINNDKLKAPFSTFYDKFLKSALDALGDADTKKNDQALQTNLIALTNNCNSCHNENNMSFMKIQP
jgi:predicted transcriptional regulator